MKRMMKANDKLRKSHDIQRITGHLLELAVKNISLDEILKQCLNMILAVPWLAFDRTGSIFIAQDNSDTLEMRAQKGIDKKLLAQCRQIKSGQCLCGLAAEKKKIIFTPHINKYHTFSTPNTKEHGHYCVPIIFSKKALGVVNIYIKAGHTRNKTEERFLTAIANALAGIIQRKRIEQALERSSRALQALSACNHILIHATEEKKLLKDVCRIIVNISGYKMVWIGIAENNEYKSVKPLAWAGTGREYLTAAKISWNAENPRSGGPTGTAIRTGKISLARNFANDPRLLPWRKEALRRGFYSSIAIPLKSSRITFGALTIYATEPDAFDKKEIFFLQELTNDLAFGLETIRLRKTHEKMEQEKNQVEKKLLESYKHLGAINRQISILLDLYTQSGGKNMREILEFIAKSAYNISRAELIKFFRYSKSTRSLIFLPIGNSRKFKDEKTHIPLEKHAFLKPLVERKIRVQGSFIEDLHKDFVSPSNIVKYFLFLPIISGKQLRGAVLFCFADRDSITPQELDFFEAFAAQASLVLKNLEIFKEKRIRSHEKTPVSKLKLFQPIKKVRNAQK
ncbi:MAG: GAF domain-containing protein [Candidatus Pacebacteria bacterium]|nr:GAF domain-containing protein [Candidatus Paceibacterota bacterium]MDR3583332.1 GAF domain-containing protein [Candidatus Paceibacterota bacterium]